MIKIQIIRPLKELPLTSAKLAESALTFSVCPIYLADGKIGSDVRIVVVKATPAQVNDALARDLMHTYYPLPNKGGLDEMADEVTAALKEIGMDDVSYDADDMDQFLSKTWCLICDNPKPECVCK